MPFKNYSNPLYDVVEDPDDWITGLCAIFANALQERFGLPLQALLVSSKNDPSNKTLVHAMGVLPDGRLVDARGIRHEAALMSDYDGYTDHDWREIHLAQPGEQIQVGMEPTTVEQLWDLNPEDLDATNAAHAHIDAHRELFGELDALSRRPKSRGKKRP